MAKARPIRQTVSCHASAAGMSRRQQACNSGSISARPPLTTTVAAGSDSTSFALFHSPVSRRGEGTRRADPPDIFRESTSALLRKCSSRVTVKVPWRTSPSGSQSRPVKDTISPQSIRFNAKRITVYFDRKVPLVEHSWAASAQCLVEPKVRNASYLQTDWIASELRVSLARPFQTFARRAPAPLKPLVHKSENVASASTSWRSFARHSRLLRSRPVHRARAESTDQWRYRS